MQHDESTRNVRARRSSTKTKDLESPMHFLGMPNAICSSCLSRNWVREAVGRKKKDNPAEFSICCSKGRVCLPSYRPVPDILKPLIDPYGGSHAAHFRKSCRAYNCMLNFISCGANLDRTVTGARGPYIFKISGQMHHRMGSLLPLPGNSPKFAQLYIYDTQNELQNRMNTLPRSADSEDGPKEHVVAALVHMLDQINPLAHAFRMVRDRFNAAGVETLKLKLMGSRRRDGDQYRRPAVDEIAGLIVGDFDGNKTNRDLIVEARDESLQRVNGLHPSLMSLQYPLLFPYGDDGFMLEIPYAQVPGKKIKRGHMTMMEYYAHTLMHRSNEISSLLSGGRLLQQYIVDAFCCVENTRLDWVRYNQDKFRHDLLSGVEDAVVRGDTIGAQVGQRVILPSSFTGTPRNMLMNYQDSMAICRVHGFPSLFITFTCNSKWPEIVDAFKESVGPNAEDKPDIVARIFRMKVRDLKEDIKKNKIFGETIADVHTIEFQKRGLPHVHMVVWLGQPFEDAMPSIIDKIITAELPDPQEDPEGYLAASKFMLHGPCGAQNPNASCMDDGKCTKFFPKKFAQNTTVDSNGYVIYRRRDDGRSGPNSLLDNRYVVPYNRDLVVKYQAHINVLKCTHGKLMKYLFKYLHKGPDRAKLRIAADLQCDTEVDTAYDEFSGHVADPHYAEEVHSHISNLRNVTPLLDEVKAYLDCRYLSAYESAWRLLDFPIHERHPAVQRLQVHLPNMNTVYFHETRSLRSILNNDDAKKTTLTEWFETNQQMAEGRHLTYLDFPMEFVWHSKEKVWSKRKRGQSVGRMTYVNATCGELYFLRLLLTVKRGATSFDDLKFIDGVQHTSFREACRAFGLIGDDREWEDAMVDAAAWATSPQLRNLFAIILIFCEVSNCVQLFENTKGLMSDDIVYRMQNRGSNTASVEPSLVINEVLACLEVILLRHSTSLINFGLPLPDFSQTLYPSKNRLLDEETSHDFMGLTAHFDSAYPTLNVDQKIVFDTVVSAVEQKKNEAFFMYGHGGTGKTYLYDVMASHLRSRGFIVLAVASSGIASLLLPGGRTAHSRFKIPLDPDETSTCFVKKGTNLAELFQKTDLIIWDEAPMMHRFSFEAVNRMLNDICLPIADDTDAIFGGKIMLLGGDFRQILPVVAEHDTSSAIDSCITRSLLWPRFKIFNLNINMRLTSADNSAMETENLAKFAKWLLDIGNGAVPAISLQSDQEPYWIQLPEEYVITPQGDLTTQIFNKTYPDFCDKYSDTSYLKERIMVSPLNETVNSLNDFALSHIPGKTFTYFSCDTAIEGGSEREDCILFYPVEFLNALRPNGIPDYRLTLKVNSAILLLRNLSPEKGLCNGTRLLVRKCTKNVIEAKIISGSRIGDIVHIPRITVTSKDVKWPFTLKRRQFPIRLAYAMTINKSQGQTLKTVGVYLPKPVFTHGQLYVAFSRVTNHSGLHILMDKESHQLDLYTKNIVFPEILEGI